VHGKLTDKSPFPVCFGTPKKKNVSRVQCVIIPVRENPGFLAQHAHARESRGKRRDGLSHARARVECNDHIIIYVCRKDTHTHTHDVIF